MKRMYYPVHLHSMEPLRSIPEEFKEQAEELLGCKAIGEAIHEMLTVYNRCMQPKVIQTGYFTTTQYTMSRMEKEMFTVMIDFYTWLIVNHHKTDYVEVNKMIREASEQLERIEKGW